MLGILLFLPLRCYHKEISSSIAFENSLLTSGLTRLESWVHNLLALWLFSSRKWGDVFPRMLWELMKKYMCFILPHPHLECCLAPKGCCYVCVQIRSDQISRSVVSDSLWPHELQHARPPCPSPTPGVHSDSRPSSQSCNPAISSSVVPFSSCPQSLPASGSFPMNQLFAWVQKKMWFFSGYALILCWRN